jgi:alpha-L-rhamnosidase
VNNLIHDPQHQELAKKYQDIMRRWMVDKHGATTIWERWDGWTPERGFQDPGMNSFNHYSLGSCGEWMFSSLAGIDTEGPGFKKLIIRPTPGEGITWVKASYDSINGRIVSNWELKGDKLTMDVTILANTTATLYLPTKDSATVTESGKPVSQVQGMKFLRMENGRALYEAGSGHYLIKCAMN